MDVPFPTVSPGSEAVIVIVLLAVSKVIFPDQTPFVNGPTVDGVTVPADDVRFALNPIPLKD